MIPLTSSPNLLSSRTVARQLGLTQETIRRWARSGKLPAVKIGDDWRFQTEVVSMGREKCFSQGLPEGILRRRKSKYLHMQVAGKITSTGETDVNLAQAKRYRALAEWKERVGSDENQRGQSRTVRKSPDDCKGIPPYLPTLSDLLSRYLKEVSPQKPRPGAAKSDAKDAQMPRVYLGSLPIDKVTPQAIYGYQDWRKSFWSLRKKRPVSNATINREVALVKHALHKAVRWGLIDRSPLPKGEVEGLSENKRERYITNDEIQSILPNLPRSQGFIIQTLYFSAQRAGRIFSLTWRQIDFGNRTIAFGRSIHNKRIPRIIWINDPLLKILQTLWEERGRETPISPWVFVKEDGKPYRSIKYAWNKACKLAGVEDAHIHDLRHKSISDMARKGISLQTIQKAVGHSQSSTTDRYTHLSVEDVREAFEALG